MRDEFAAQRVLKASTGSIECSGAYSPSNLAQHSGMVPTSPWFWMKFVQLYQNLNYAWRQILWFPCREILGSAPWLRSTPHTSSQLIHLRSFLEGHPRWTGFSPLGVFPILLCRPSLHYHLCLAALNRGTAGQLRSHQQKNYHGSSEPALSCAARQTFSRKLILSSNLF